MAVINEIIFSIMSHNLKCLTSVGEKITLVNMIFFDFENCDIEGFSDEEDDCNPTLN